MTEQEATKKANRKARELGVTDKDAIELATKMFMNNKYNKSLKKGVEQMLRRRMNVATPTAQEFEDMQEKSKRNQLPSSMR